MNLGWQFFFVRYGAYSSNNRYLTVLCRLVGLIRKICLNSNGCGFSSLIVEKASMWHGFENLNFIFVLLHRTKGCLIAYCNLRYHS